MRNCCNWFFGIFAFVLISAAASAQQIATSLSLAVTPATVVAGQSVTATATLATASGPVSAADGLRVRVAGIGIGCTATLKSGVATCKATVQPVPDGPPYEATGYASFGGNAQLHASTSNVVSISILAPGSTVPSVLQGPYIFQFNGYTDAPAAGAAPRVAGLGRLVADGNGNLSGQVSYNGSVLTADSTPVTGTYAISTSGTGTFTLTSGKVTQHFDIFVGLPATTGATDASLLETDEVLLWGSASLRSQTSTSLAIDTAAEAGIYHAVLAGETECGDCSTTGHASGEVRAVWSIRFAGSATPTFTLEGDQTIKNSTMQHVVASGDYTPPDSTGKLTITLTSGAGWPDEPTRLAGYVVDASHIALSTGDPHAQFILLSGDALR